eukprot:214139_1
MISNMTMDLHRIKQIDIKIRYLIFGYARESQKLLPNNTSYWNIPELIKFTILSYYHIKDEWDKMNTDSSYIIVDDCITKGENTNVGKYGGDKTAFLKHMVSDGIYKWSFKIENMLQPGKWNDFIIGIYSTDLNFDKVREQSFCYESGIAFVASKGQIFTAPCNYDAKRDYGVKCKNNDVIDMELNMNKLQLKFIINGTDYEKAYDLKSGKYKAAVYLYKTNSALRII